MKLIIGFLFLASPAFAVEAPVALPKIPKIVAVCDLSIKNPTPAQAAKLAALKVKEGCEQ